MSLSGAAVLCAALWTLRLCGEEAAGSNAAKGNL